ncbi:hypothetical protein ACFQJ5_16700 [Halomicroarcula sp. GCM10025324]|uniref:hypothetical protein n=1 Tax=Haloarcula TaxID=2237 RepID=UPI0023E8527F|nr:hypothetical protein [Halomicroarcula sp. ZS-22-S1]
MDDELERLIDTLLNEGIRCFACNTEFGIQAEDLEPQSEQIYTTRYNCSGDDCSIEYHIEVEDRDFALSFRANERGSDRPDDLPDISKYTRKEPLQQKSHPARKINDAAVELVNSIAILKHNQQRLQVAKEIVEDEGIDQDGDFHRRIRADIHNYCAAAYSFEKILGKNVEPHLPLDGPIEDAKNEFEDEHEVIKALRTYAQHHLTLPSSIAHFLGPTTEGGDITITVPVDDLDDFSPRASDASFEPVEGDHIRIVDRVNRHYQAAENLVNTMLEMAEEEYNNRLEDYQEATSYPEWGGS